VGSPQLPLRLDLAFLAILPFGVRRYRDDAGKNADPASVVKIICETYRPTISLPRRPRIGDDGRMDNGRVFDAGHLAERRVEVLRG